ncbi:apolipoprotein L4-like isoform X3 [Macaca thibetana thibetana]|uniref:apolipoprotein L4-like isoform X3 n=1 Tax=Macaca thibetana thibetana TaxID=257877 RepID=UPI0021BC50F0|nr:apolipoprotein L4-like isoform X3 [Macaca thibetana thibetana]XP_050662273.1 apolipoprotein L4-like isoform X3 [Macaca thibetana thibetana]XP_050662274.1 apolipoprotein L4-like isoform X3 [Macaca thibetana thibetana]
MEGASLLRVFVLCIWMQQNHPGRTMAGQFHGKPLSDLAAEKKCFTEEVTEYFQKNVSPGHLKILLTDDEAWKRLVAVAELPRDEADALYEALKNLTPYAAIEDKDVQQKDQQLTEWFLKQFPQLSWKIQESIERIRVIANEIEEFHRGCTIANVVSGSTGTASGVLSVVGFLLAPFTAGLSLGVTAVGLGLGIASATTGISTSIVENTYTKSAELRASRLTATSRDLLKVLGDTLSEITPSVLSFALDFDEVTKMIANDVRTLRRSKATVGRPLNIRRLIPTNVIDELKTPGAAKRMVRKAVPKAASGALLVLDVVQLVQDSQHLHEGAKSESAEELRQWAQELQKNLNELTQIHQSLKAGWAQ